MKTYKTLRDLPLIPEGTVFTLSRGLNEYRMLKEGKLKDYAEGDRVCATIYLTMLNSALAVGGRLEEVTKPSYIVTEEGEIIGEYGGKCWYVVDLELYERSCCHLGEEHCFITIEQAEAYVKREKARRELRVLYYENRYEENKGDYEVFYDPTCTDKLTCFEGITNPGLPHCKEDFQEEMLELPRVQELYSIIFGIDGN